MNRETSGLIPGFGVGLSLRKWRRALDRPEALSQAELASIDAGVKGLRDSLDGLSFRLRSETSRRKNNDLGIELPVQCDWVTRATPWAVDMQPRGLINPESPQMLPGEVKLFHDATLSDLSLRQDPVPPGRGSALYGLVFEIYRFDGSFVSIVQDLPKAALDGLTRSHFIAIKMIVDREQPVEIFARLNIQHGPNLEQIVRQIEFDGETGAAEFDLAYSDINEKRLEKAWLDLIIEGPHMTRIALWDLVILRALRADV